MANAAAFELVVEALGREPRFAGLVELGRTLAAALDADGGNASLAREYRNCLLDLMEASDADGDEFGDLLARFAAGSDSPEG